MPGLSEFEIIERFFRRGQESADILIGIGDDAAVVDVREPLVVAVDTLTEGTHFPADFPARALGHRILAVNLSDFAAMGARPRWCTLSLSVPEADAEWLGAFADGLFALADQYDVRLIGGDTVRGPLTVSLQLLGTVEADRALRRGGGRLGDDVYVTGTLGDAAAGLAVLQNTLAVGPEQGAALVERFCYPSPRVAAARALAGLAHAAIDVSDGLLADLGHVAAQSGCAAVVDIEAVPVSTALSSAVAIERAQELALCGGDDYELCFTAAADARDAIGAVARSAVVRISCIGRLVAGAGVELRSHGRPTARPDGGFRHF